MGNTNSRRSPGWGCLSRDRHKAHPKYDRSVTIYLQIKC